MSDRGVIQRLIISISHPPGNSDQRSRFLWHSQPDPRAHLFPFVRPPPSPRSPQDKQHGCKAIGDILRWLHRTETDSISFDCSSKQRLKFLLQLFSGKGKALCNCQIYTGHADILLVYVFVSEELEPPLIGSNGHIPTFPSLFPSRNVVSATPLDMW